jgi:hypothetical protein
VELFRQEGLRVFPAVWWLVSQRACEDKHPEVRRTALYLLEMHRMDLPKIRWKLIAQRAREDRDSSVRCTALELLAQRYREEETTWELVTQCACEDQAGFVRPTALELLVKHYRLDNRTLIILSRDLDGYEPYLDFSEPIRASWVEKCAVKLQVSVDEIWAVFRKLADILPLNLDIST